ncbi:MAG: hypothetical protein ISR57_08600, partial [Bacteroidales bacterium]|nr:hypothetical protein [Bacteroidales bacterium]
MRFISLLIYLLGVLSLSLHGQQITVLDKSDLQPIDQVSITNHNNNFLVVTNFRGEADLSEFSDSDSLFFTHIAFQPYITTKEHVMQTGGIVYLTDHIIRLDEFVISASRTREKKSDLP